MKNLEDYAYITVTSSQRTPTKLWAKANTKNKSPLQHIVNFSITEDGNVAGAHQEDKSDSH